ncbi:MAG: hypothetical protein K0S39_2477 [Paenibacillus sp.]|jgi:hypothetical protein|nr:hypothetical protein [Paenibacillus sp.]
MLFKQGVLDKLAEETVTLAGSTLLTPVGGLADIAGRDKETLKLDVRKLNNPGLTISLGTGCRTSPRGEALLGVITAAAQEV